MKKFSDFAEMQALEGEKLRLDDVLNKPVIITAQRITASKYSKNESGKYLTLQFHFPNENETKILFTGSDVLISQIEDYKEEIPFEATIKKINRYYTFT
jgi:hypothetical protein